MPNRAKLTTRSISTTTVTTDALPKNAALTNNELDSNFINLRDQSFSIVGDDSSGIDIKAGDTIKFLGSGGATITATGSTITVTAGGGGGTGDLTIVGSTISGPSNADIDITAGGTGDINLNADTVRLGDENASVVLTSNGATSGDFTIKIGSDSTPYIKLTDAGTIEIAPDINSATFLKSDITTLGSGSSSGTLNTNGAVDLILRTNVVDTSSRIELKPGANGDINIWPNGTGKIQLDNNYWPNTDGTNGQALITDGAGNLSWGSASAQGITFVGDDSTGTRISDNETVKIAGGTGITTAMSGDVLTITATGGGGTGDLTITGTTISGPSNSIISIVSNGTGDINLQSPTIEFGQGNDDVTLTSAGRGDMILRAGENTGAGTSSTILLEHNLAANGNIVLRPMNEGYVVVGNGTNNGLITSNGNKFLRLDTNSGTNSGYIQITAGANEPISLVPNGTGNVDIEADTVKIGDSNTDATITTNGTGDLILNTNSGTNTGSITIADGVNGNITLSPNGTGSVVLDGLSYPQSDGTNGQVLTTNGSGVLSFTSAGGTVTSITAGTGLSGGTITTTGTIAIDSTVATLTGSQILTNKSISLTTNTITGTLAEFNTALSGDDFVSLTGAETLTNKTLTSPVIAQIVSVSNGNIELAPNGTGDVLLTADTVRVGDSNANVTITTNGTGDLILNTNGGTTSNSIVIEDTATGRIQLIPNSTGRIDLGPVADGSATGLVNFPSAITGNSLGPGDARFKGTGRFHSNLAYTPYTAVTSQEIPNNDYAMLKTDGGSFDSINIRNPAAAHSMIFDLNGGSATSTTTNVTGTGVRAANNQLWYMNTAGGTKTGLNISVTGNASNIVAGHGGALTIPRVVGYVNDVNFARNTGDTTTVTEMWAFRDQGIAYSGTGTTGTNSILTDYVAFETGVSAPSSTNTPWAFRVRSTSQSWRSSIGAVDLPKRWGTVTTHSASGAYTVDYQSTGNGFRQITLGANITSFTMSNFPVSTNIISEFDIVFIQDGTGGRTISFTPTSTEVFKFRNGTSSLSDSTAAPEVLHAKVFVRYDGTKSIYYWDIDNREYV